MANGETLRTQKSLGAVWHGVLHENASFALPCVVAHEGDLAAIGRPDGTAIVGGMGGQSHRRVGADPSNINIKVVALGTLPGIRDPLAVSRKGGLVDSPRVRGERNEPRRFWEGIAERPRRGLQNRLG